MQKRNFVIRPPRRAVFHILADHIFVTRCVSALEVCDLRKENIKRVSAFGDDGIDTAVERSYRYVKK